MIELLEWAKRWEPLLTPAATFAAILVALFHPSLLEWWRSPKLMLRMGRDFNRRGSGIAGSQYDLGVEVRNKGRSAAMNVRLMIHGIVELRGGRWTRLEGFQVTEYVLTPTEEPWLPAGLSSVMPIARIPDAAHTQVAGQSDQTKAHVMLTGKSPGHRMLSAGTYRLKLTVAGSNTAATSKRFTLHFDGKFHESEEKMFSTGVTLKLWRRWDDVRRRLLPS